MTGNELRGLRKDLKLTQAEMAQEMGLSLRAYTEVENGVDKIRAIHRLSADVVSLKQAVAQQKHELATPEVRALALDLARLIRGQTI